MQLMLVPLGCPYDAAAHVLKGHTLDTSLPQSALELVRRDPAVAVAAPLLLASAPSPAQGRADLWVGLDEAARRLKPWWKVRTGAAWFTGPDSVILGSEAAAVEMRTPGDKLHCPEAGRTLQVAGVLERSGTSDDSGFFIPLATAQRIWRLDGRLTAIAIRLRDPALLAEAGERLQRIPGAQVVTLTEMMGTFLNLVGSVRTLLQAIALIAVVVSALALFNTLLGAVLERTPELSVLRALGASRGLLFALLITESLLLTGAGTGLGLALAWAGGPTLEAAVKHFVPFAPRESMVALTAPIAWECLVLGAAVGLVGALYPAWQASRVPPGGALRWGT
jgi:putative ABC transport system permease protein